MGRTLFRGMSDFKPDGHPILIHKLEKSWGKATFGCTIKKNFID
ncbi:MAG: hypothetical protein ACI9S8_002547 [Chlamydiales bacterium]|jgi:hypothetical protein